MNFLIVWGTKIKRQRLGRVADFCPICRDFRPFTVHRVGAAGHVYYISVGKGKLVGHEIKCEDCGVAQSADLDFYRTISQDPLAAAHELEAVTTPHLREAYEERLAIESRLRSGSLDPEQRRNLLFEPFALLSHLVEERAAATHFDRKSAAGCLVGVAALLGLVVAAILESGPLAIAMTVLLGLGFLMTLLCLATDVTRHTRARVLPLLARALRPLQPRDEELAASLQECKVRKLVIGRKVKVPRLQEAIRQPETPATPLLPG